MNRGHVDLSSKRSERVVLDAIKEGLSSIGNSPREAIFHGFEASFQMKEEDIPLNLNEFRDFLETIFGSGTPYLEGIITKQLCEKLGLDPGNPKTSNLVVCIDELKR